MSKTGSLPKHIAVIPDGNRRWAVAHGYSKESGYAFGLDSGLDFFDHCLSLGIEEMTFYGFTNDNTRRPVEQREAFSKACVMAVEQMKDKDGSILVVGNSDSQMFPKELLKYKVRKPSGKNKLKINFLVNYDWQWDLTSALIQKSHFHRHELAKCIASSEIPRVDLVIRWGGRRRLSGMLPVQTVYSDFYVEDQMWPDYHPTQLEKALDWYVLQDKTLGG